MRLFVFTLGCSRKSVRLLTRRSSTQMWAELYERAFRRLGGTIKVIILDNPGEGVLTPDIDRRHFAPPRANAALAIEKVIVEAETTRRIRVEALTAMQE